MPSVSCVPQGDNGVTQSEEVGVCGARCILTAFTPEADRWVMVDPPFRLLEQKSALDAVKKCSFHILQRCLMVIIFVLCSVVDILYSMCIKTEFTLSPIPSFLFSTFWLNTATQ